MSGGRRTGVARHPRRRGRRVSTSARSLWRSAPRHSAVMLYSRELLVAAIYQVAAPALFATPATTSEKSHADALSHLPSLDTCAEHVDYAHRLMSGHPRPCHPKGALNRRRIGMANAASLPAGAHIVGWWLDHRCPC